MAPLRVCFGLRPKLYTDLLARLMRSTHLVEVIEVHRDSGSLAGFGAQVDVVIITLDEDGRPELDALPAPLPQAKYIAFSVDGECGKIRFPGKDDWHEVRPFGLERLIYEVMDSQYHH